VTATRRNDRSAPAAGLALAERYAESLMAETDGDAEADAQAAELEALRGAMERVEGLEALLAGGTLGASQRAEVLGRLLGGRVGEKTEALVELMSERGHLGLLKDVAGAFRSRVNARQGKVAVTVTSAAALDAAQVAALERGLSEALGAEAIVAIRVDPSLIGGLVVRVGDRVIDASVAGALNQMRQWLTGEAEAPDESGPAARGRKET
jgi:F-type H+-transporting ATPase subunit delta